MSKSENTTTPSTSDLLTQNTNTHYQHLIKYINIQQDSTTSPATTNNNKAKNIPNPSTSKFMSKVNNICKSITTTRIRNNIENASTTSSITLPSLHKSKVKKDKTEEFINKILSRKENDLKKTHHQTKPPSTITRNDKNKICHPLFTTKKLTLISISMKTSIHTYQCGHIKIITYPPYQQQVTTKTINTKGSKQQNFSYFKCKKKTNKNQQNAVLRD